MTSRRRWRNQTVTDSIDDMGLLRHGALPGLSGGLRAPSTLGSFLRSFTWGNVLQLQKVHREVLAGLPAAPRCCPARARSPSWTSIRSRSGSTAITSTVPRSGIRRSPGRACWYVA
jgi:hypothetical protein